MCVECLISRLRCEILRSVKLSLYRKDVDAVHKSKPIIIIPTDHTEICDIYIFFNTISKLWLKLKDKWKHIPHCNLILSYNEICLWNCFSMHHSKNEKTAKFNCYEEVAYFVFVLNRMTQSRYAIQFGEKKNVNRIFHWLCHHCSRALVRGNRFEIVHVYGSVEISSAAYNHLLILFYFRSIRWSLKR